MNNFFINSIKKIVKQREEQPPEQVHFYTLSPLSRLNLTRL